ncbi:MAG: DUF4364 family protein [Ruminococcaceae bacterium]|nr:DUF4364 family protein [Oscillospiraceae bacterium]
MPQVGFIRNKQEIKFLILYIAERLIAPVPFEVMQELTMCDPAIDFFDFSECLNYLVDTGHMTCSESDLYAVTEKGIQNGRACVDEIPYSVRLTADRLAEEQNQRIKRARQVQSTVTPDGGGFRVLLSFNDDAGEPFWRMELTVPDEEKAKALVKRFQDAPEKLYGELIELLFPEEEA